MNDEGTPDCGRWTIYEADPDSSPALPGRVIGVGHGHPPLNGYCATEVVPVAEVERLRKALGDLRFLRESSPYARKVIDEALNA